MKRTIYIVSALLLTVALNAQTTKTLKKVLELQMPGEGGANGASVAWHPVQKKYYAAMAGNTTFPFGVFDVKGKRLSAEDQTTMFDVRGLWYNPDTKKLETNGYNEFGWASYQLDSKGMPTEVVVTKEGMNQPAEQSVGAYDPKRKLVYFFNEDDNGTLDEYDAESAGYDDYNELFLGATKSEEHFGNEDIIDGYNTTTVIYTGVKGAELGLLNTIDKQVELYDVETGLMKQVLKLPSTMHVSASLNFSFSNGTYWFFDKNNRKWIGFR